MDDDFSTNEGKFFESIRRFAKKVAETSPVDAAGLEDLVNFYAKPDRKTDPLLLLPPSNAKELQQVQRRVAPDLDGHPFFRRVADIATERWGAATQELLDAHRYIIQISISPHISPLCKPRPEVLQVVRDAKKTAFFYAERACDPAWRGSSTSDSSRLAPATSQKSFDIASIVADFVKKNW